MPETAAPDPRATVVPTARATPVVPGGPPAGRALAALLTAGVVAGLGISAAGAAGALLMVEVTGTDALAGLPQTAVVVGAGAAALILSAVTRRWGRGPALAGGAGVAVPGALLAVAGGWWGSAVAVLAGSLLLGAGQAAMMLARYAAADLATPDRRARAMATVLVATTVGSVLGPNLMPAAGAVAEALGGPLLTGPYLLAAATSLLAAAVLAVGLRRGGEFPAGVGPEPEGGLPPRPVVGRGVRAAWRGFGPDATLGLATLAVANLVMVGVMTMAPVHLADIGMGLGGIGLVISLHIAAMFAPSPLSGWLVDTWGARPAALVAGAVLAVACVVTALGAGSHGALPVGLVLLGAGWNLGLVSGSVLLTRDAGADRPRREGLGEALMAAAAALGGGLSGVLVAGADYRTLAIAGLAAAAALVVVLAARLRGAGVPAQPHL